MVLAMAAAIDQIRRCLQEIAAIAWERQTRESARVPLPRHLHTEALCFVECLYLEVGKFLIFMCFFKYALQANGPSSPEVK